MRTVGEDPDFVPESAPAVPRWGPDSKGKDNMDPCVKQEAEPREERAGKAFATMRKYYLESKHTTIGKEHLFVDNRQDLERSLVA